MSKIDKDKVIDACIARENQLRAMCDELREAIGKIEWSTKTPFGKPCCPFCLSMETHGHEDGCVVGEALTPTDEDKLDASHLIELQNDSDERRNR